MKFVIVYPKSDLVYVDGVELKFDYSIPLNLPQNLTMIHWKDPDLDGSFYRVDGSDENQPLEETEENYELWIEPFVKQWDAQWVKVSPALIQKQLTDAVQDVLDARARDLNYDSCLSVCSYVDTGVKRFDTEGTAFRKWRSAVWEKGYEILAEVQAGDRAIPSESELLDELPKLVIEYSE